MIFFIAPNPNRNKQREGFLQRIYAIDQLFASEEKKYIEDCIDETEIVRYLIDSDVIYIHSMYQASQIKDYIEYFADKIIIDLHGVVPEELEYMGDTLASEVMNETEAYVFAHIRHYVAVTNAMVRYYKKKYRKVASKLNWIVLPIFDNGVIVEKRPYKSKKLNIIYAGGTQKWQSIDKMIATIKQLRESKIFTFTILSHDKAVFSDIEVYDNVTVASIATDDVPRYYNQAVLGFILRDDSIVNKVACPTKLIEYFEYNIVPIVDYETIGDFKELGYKYVSYTDINEATISRDRLDLITQHNHTVVEKLRKISDEGKIQLHSVVNAIKRQKDPLTQIGELSKLTTRVVAEVENFRHSNDKLKHDLEDNVAELAVLKKEIIDIKSSKMWCLLTKISKLFGKKL